MTLSRCSGNIGGGRGGLRVYVSARRYHDYVQSGEATPRSYGVQHEDGVHFPVGPRYDPNMKKALVFGIVMLLTAAAFAEPYHHHHRRHHHHVAIER
jgi:hypothetical protein